MTLDMLEAKVKSILLNTPTFICFVKIEFVYIYMYIDQATQSLS